MDRAVYASEADAVNRLLNNKVDVWPEGKEIALTHNNPVGIKLWGAVDFLCRRHGYFWRNEIPRPRRGKKEFEPTLRLIPKRRECHNCAELDKRRCTGNGECHLKVILGSTLIEPGKIEKLSAVLARLGLVLRGTGGTFVVVGAKR